MNHKLLKFQRLLGVCVILILAIAIGKSFSVGPLAHKMRPSTIHVEQLEWESCTQIDDNTWDYTYRLPNQIMTDDVISVGTYWASVNVYAGDRLLLKFDDSEKEKGSTRQWIRLPLWTGGKTLHVRYSGERSRVELSAKETAYYGNAALVYLVFVADQAYALIFAVAVCLMLIIMAYFYRLMRHQMDVSMRRSLWFLGSFILMTGIWIVCDSKILFALSRNIAGNTIASYASLTLFPMFLTMFVSEVTDHRMRFLDVLPILYMVDLVFMMTAHLTHLISLDHTLITVHVLMVVTIVAILAGGIMDVRKHKNRDMKKILIGFVGFAIFAVIALIRFNLSPTTNYAPVFCAGLYYFIFFVVWAAYDRLYRLMGHNAKVMAYQRLAYRDVLTNLGNRAAFVKKQSELSTDAKVGFVVLDINNLKHTNDCFGHQAGDELICCAADCISQVFKGKGKAYRIGGDEFVVVVDSATEEFLRMLLRRLEDVQKEKQEELDVPWKLQIAYGYALHQDESSYDELFRQADDRMYECKRRMKEMEQSTESENM